MTNLAGEAMNARCGDYVCEIVGFRGVKPDSEETPDYLNECQTAGKP
jgi:hypothetical protein